MTWTPTIENCDNYLGSREGRYEWRRVRYKATLDAMKATCDLSDTDTVVDLGAGWTELDYCLRTEGVWKGRYIPIDGGIDGTDLNRWIPQRPAEWFVALEILEHLANPFRLIELAKRAANKGVIISTPNPRTTDVLGMDPTHVTPICAEDLTRIGFLVQERSFYGQPDDSLFGVWTR